MRNKFILEIEKFYILLSCFFKFLIYGRADKRVENPGKILVVQMAKMGDMVCTTPMFRAVKERYPNAKICVMGSNINKELLEDNPDVDEYLAYDGDFWGLIKNLRRQNIDIACLINVNFMLLAALYLSKIPLVIAAKMVNDVCVLQTRLYKLLSKLVVVKIHKMRNYGPREYLRLLEPINIFTDKTQKHLNYSLEAEKTINDFFIQNNIDLSHNMIVGIAPSAGNKLKIWGGKKFAQLIDLISSNDRQAKIIILGSGNDEYYISEVLANLPAKTKVINTCNKFSVDELKALISKLNVLIGPDTGLIYIAEAFGVLTIDITGPVDEKEQPPIGQKHKVVFVDVECRPCSLLMNTARFCKNKKQPFICFEKVTAEYVYQEMKNLINNIKEAAESK